MWRFKKKDSSMKLPDLPGNWKELLHTCNFLLARKELEYFFKISDSLSEQEGGIRIYRKEFVDGCVTFANRPCFETAVALIEGAPEYAPLVWAYFIECCPGGRSWSYYSLLGDRYLN